MTKIEDDRFKESIKEWKELDKNKIIIQTEIINLFEEKKISRPVAYIILTDIIRIFERVDPTSKIATLITDKIFRELSLEEKRKIKDFLIKKKNEKTK